MTSFSKRGRVRHVSEVPRCALEDRGLHGDNRVTVAVRLAVIGTVSAIPGAGRWSRA